LLLLSFCFLFVFIISQQIKDQALLDQFKRTDHLNSGDIFKAVNQIIQIEAGSLPWVWM
jgi:hypothetical protein